ncbi:MAG: AAA family ATPase [Chitinivibrionales bacterium]
MRSITIDNVDITLSRPLNKEVEWIGQSEAERQVQACWLSVHEKDLPLTPRIIGHPGVGKTTLAIAAAQKRGQDVYILQCTSDTRPEDLLITPVLSNSGKISYHASPLLSAVVTGGVAVLDEGNRMAEKSWASLTGLFDNRRRVESVVAGITIEADSGFRAAVTMNEDESTFEIPDYIMSRLQPGIEVGFPDQEDEMRILSYSLPFSDKEVLSICVDFLQKAHSLDLPYSVRDGIHAVSYTLKQKKADPGKETENLFEQSVKQILGEEALDLEGLAKRRSKGSDDSRGMHLGDFFFPEDDPLNPDS